MRPGTAPLFDSVVVVTDRRVLDRQLRDNIGVLRSQKHFGPRRHQRRAKNPSGKGKKIIITTIQKFPFIVDGIEDMSTSAFAVIIDEAHSSQSGTAADKIKRHPGHADDEEEAGRRPGQNHAGYGGRKLGRNASYFAFTATPKNATLEKFGQPDADGKNFKPLPPLLHETGHRGRLHPRRAGQLHHLPKLLRNRRNQSATIPSSTPSRRKRSCGPSWKATKTIAVKADIMSTISCSRSMAPKKLKGQAKGMVVTRNIDRHPLLPGHEAPPQAGQCPFQAIVAFSGKKLVDGIEYTEESCNGFPSKRH
jgi:type I restriction enzyme, R subunit